MDDLISRQDAMDALGIIADKMTTDGQTVIEQAIAIIRDLSPAKITLEDIREYCRPRCLTIITDELLEQLKRGKAT